MSGSTNALDDLIGALRSNPTDARTLDQVDALLRQKGDWDTLYDVYIDLARRARDGATRVRLQDRVARALAAHASSTDDPATASALLVRSGDLLSGPLNRPVEAATRYLDAFHALPEPHALDLALGLVEGIGDRTFARELLEARLQVAPSGDDRRSVLLRLAGMAIDDEALGRAATLLEEVGSTGDEPVAALQERLGDLRAARRRRVEGLRRAVEAARPGPDRARTLVRLASELLRGEPGAEERSEAQQAWENAIAEDASGPAAVEALEALERELQGAGAIAELERVWQRVVDATTEDALLLHAHRGLGLLALGAGDPGHLAAGHLRAALDIEPADPEALDGLAAVLRASGDWRALVDVLERRRALTRGRTEDHTLQQEIATILWLRLDEHEAAERLFRRIRGNDRQSAVALAFYDDWYTRQQDWRRAVTTLEQRAELAKSPQERLALTRRAARIAQEQLPGTDKAIDACRAVFELQPDDEVAETLAALYAGAGRWHALLDLMEERLVVAADVPTKVGLLEQIAAVYRDPARLPVDEMVVKTLWRVLELQPERLDLLDEIAARTEASGRWAEVAEALERRVQASPEGADGLAARRRLAMLYVRRLGRPANAVPHLIGVLQAAPDDLEAVRALKGVYRAQQDIRGLAAMLQREVELLAGQERIVALVELAVLSRDRLGDLDTAIECWEQVLAEEPGNERALAMLTTLYEAGERWAPLADVLERRAATAPTRQRRAALWEQVARLREEHLDDADGAARARAALAASRPSGANLQAGLQALSLDDKSWAELREEHAAREDWRGWAGVIEKTVELVEDVESRVDMLVELAGIYDDKLHDPRRSLMRWEAALSAAPDHVPAARVLSRRFEERRSWRKLAEAQAAIATHSDDPTEVRASQERLVELHGARLNEPAAAFDWAARAVLGAAAEGGAGDLFRLLSLAEEADRFDELTATCEGAEALLGAHDAARLQVVLLHARVLRERLQRPDDAAVLYERALAIDPTSDEALSGLEEIAIRGSDWARLEQTLWLRVHATEGRPESRTWLLRLGELYEDFLDSPDRALEVYQRLRALDPADTAALEGARRMLERQERRGELAELLSGAVAVEQDPPRRHDLLVELGRLHLEHLGSPERALAQWARVLEEAPDAADAQAAVRGLVDRGILPREAAATLEAAVRHTGDADALLAVLEARATIEDHPDVRLEVLTELAGLYEAQGDAAGRAFDLYREVFLHHPESSDVWGGLARTAEIADLWAALAGLYGAATGIGQADVALERPLEDEPARLEILRRQADILDRRLGDAHGAIACYEEVLGHTPSDPELLVALARLYRQTGDHECMLLVLRKQAEIEPERRRRKALLRRAAEVAERDLHNGAEATALLQAALALDGGDHEIVTELLRLARATEDWDAVAGLLRHRIAHAAQADESLHLHVELAKVLHEQLGDVERAIETLRAASALDPRHDDPRAALLAIAQDPALPDRAHNVPRAVAALRPLLEADGDAEALVLLEELRAEAAIDGGEATLGEAIAALRDIAHIYGVTLGDDEQAHGALQRALALRPGDRGTLNALIQMAGRTGAWTQLVASLDEAERAAAATGDVGTQVSLLIASADVAREQLGDADVAIERLQQAAGLDPTDAQVLRSLDALLAAAGRDAEREDALRRLAEIDGPEQLDSLRALGEVRRTLGDTAGALEAWQQAAAAASGDDTQARHALDAVEALATEAARWDLVADALRRKADLAVDPEQERLVLYALAGVYEDRLDQLPEALDAFDRVLASTPGDDTSLRARERILGALGRWEELSAHLHAQIDEQPPGTYRDSLTLSLARLQEEQLDLAGEALAGYWAVAMREPASAPASDAVRALWRLVNRDDVGWDATEALMEALERRGDPEGLIELETVRGERFPDRVDVVAGLRRAARRASDDLGDPARAFGLLAQAFTQQPDDDALWSELCAVAVGPEAGPRLVDVVQEVRERLAEPERRGALAWRAAEHVREVIGDMESATTLLWLVIEDEPGHLPALEQLEDLHAGLDQWDKVLEVLERVVAVTDDPAQRVVVLYQMGSLLQGALERDLEALDLYERVLQIDAGEIDAYTHMEAIFANNAAWDDVARVLVRALDAVEADPNQSDEAQRLKRRICVVLWEKRGEVELALGFASELIGQDPKDPAAERVLRAMWAEGIEPERVGELLLQSHEAAGRWSEAVGLLQARAQDAAPADAAAALDRVAAIHRDHLNDTDGWFKAARQAAHLDPTVSRLEALERAARRREAWSDLDKLYTTLLQEVASEELKLTIGLRLADLRERQLDDPWAAAAAYQDVLARNERDMHAALSLERLYRRLERWEDLVDLFEQMALISEADGERVALYMKAVNLWDEFLSRPERAADDLRRVLEIDPSNKEARARLERILLRSAAYMELGDCYREWIDAEQGASTATETRFKLAFLLAEHLDDLPEALEQMQVLLDAAPGYPAAIRWLESLLDRVPAGDDADSQRLPLALLLESQYGEDTPWQRWARVIETQLAHTDDGDLRALLLLRLGELSRDRADDPETALQRFGEALALVPGDESLEDDLAALAQRAGLLGQLRDLWLSLADGLDDPDLADRYLLRAAELSEDALDDPAAAAPLWRRYADRHPEHPRAQAAVEAQLDASGDDEALATLLERRLERETDPTAIADLHRRAAELRRTTGHADLAADHLRALLALDPSDLDASERLEAIASDQKDWVGLVAIYRERLEHLEAPERRVEVLSRLAQIFERYLGRIDEAVGCYRAIFDLNPNNLYAITSLERLYPVVEGWHELLDVLLHKRELFASPRDKIEINHAVGRLWQEHLGNAEQALDFYRVVLDWDPQHTPTIEALEEMIRDGEQTFLASLVIEPIYEAAGDWRKLARLFSLQLPNIDDAAERAALHVRAAEVFEQRLDDPDQAIASLALALREDTQNADVRTALVDVAERHERWQTLLQRVGELLDDAPELDPSRDASLWLARLAEQKADDRDEAIRRYRRVIDADEMHTEAHAALERLLIAEERWSDLVDLLARRVAAAGPAERQSLRLRIADVMLDRLRDADASLALLTELLAEDGTRDKAVQMLERLAGRHGEMREDVLAVLEPVYRRTERWDHMAKLLDLCIQATKDPVRRGELGHTLGVLSRDRLGRADLAFDAWMRALVDDPNRAPSVLPVLTELASSLDRWEPLADALDQAVDAPQLMDVRLQHTLLLRSGEIRLDRLDDALGAEERLRRALELDPQSATALEALERLYEGAGRHADVVEICERRAELPLSFEEQRRLYGKMAAAARAMRDTGKAVEAYRRVLDLDAADHEAMRMLELLYESTGDWSSLAAVLEREASIPGRAPAEMAELRLRLARLREEKLHDQEGAVEAWEEALELQPDNSDALGALDRLYQELESWDALRGVLERMAQAAATDKARIGVWHRLARLHERQLNDVEGAIEYNQRVLDLDRSSADAINELVRLYHKHARWRELAELYEAKIGLMARGAERNNLLVKSAELWERHLDEPDKAMDNLQEVLESEPEHVYALRVLARLKERHGDWIDALEILEQLLPQLVEPEERLDVLVKIGRLQAEQGDDDEAALNAYAEAIELDPNHRGANDALRALYARRERWNELIEVVQRQLQWAPSDRDKAALYRELALIWRDRIGRRDLFLKNIEKAYELRADDPETVKAMLEFYEQVQDWEQVAPLLEWLVGYLEQRRMHQHVPKYAHRLGLVQEKLNQRDEALQSYSRAYKQDATYFPNLLSYGRLLIRLGRYEQALIIYQAMQLQQHDAPDDVKIEIFFNLGQICLKLGDSTKAKHYFLRLQRIDRNHAPTLAVLERLEKEESGG